MRRVIRSWSCLIGHYFVFIISFFRGVFFLLIFCWCRKIASALSFIYIRHRQSERTGSLIKFSNRPIPIPIGFECAKWAYACCATAKHTQLTREEEKKAQQKQKNRRQFIGNRRKTFTILHVVKNVNLSSQNDLNARMSYQRICFQFQAVPFSSTIFFFFSIFHLTLASNNVKRAKKKNNETKISTHFTFSSDTSIFGYSINKRAHTQNCAPSNFSGATARPNGFPPINKSKKKIRYNHRNYDSSVIH